MKRPPEVFDFDAMLTRIGAGSEPDIRVEYRTAFFGTTNCLVVLGTGEVFYAESDASLLPSHAASGATSIGRYSMKLARDELARLLVFLRDCDVETIPTRLSPVPTEWSEVIAISSGGTTLEKWNRAEKLASDEFRQVRVKLLELIRGIRQHKLGVLAAGLRAPGPLPLDEAASFTVVLRNVGKKEEIVFAPVKDADARTVLALELLDDYRRRVELTPLSVSRPPRREIIEIGVGETVSVTVDEAGESTAAPQTPDQEACEEYVTLFPGEELTVTASVDLGFEKPGRYKVRLVCRAPYMHNPPERWVSGVAYSEVQEVTVVSRSLDSRDADDSERED
ncbi:MAG: hypothetical protein ACYTFI_00680 [Planctomycetota bacterium]